MKKKIPEYYVFRILMKLIVHYILLFDEHWRN